MRRLHRFMVYVFCLFSFWLQASLSVSAEPAVFSATSYRIKVFLFFNPATEMPDPVRKAIVDTLRDRCRMLFGPLYELEPEFVQNETAAMLKARFAEPPPSWETFDKVFIVELLSDRSLRVAEYDTLTRFSAREGVYDLEHPSKTVDTLAFALFEQISPIAKLEKTSSETATLRIKGADPALLLSAASLSSGGGREITSLAGIEVHKSVLLPFVRTMDRNGKLIGVSRIPWTVLVPERIDPITGLARCRIQSSIRSSLGTRRRGQTEIYALAVPTPMLPTRLRLRPRSESKRSSQTLPMYEVCEALPGDNKPVVIGRTETDGTFLLEPLQDRPVRTILIRGGRTLIAQAPVVRGLEPELTIPIPDDSVRLEAESVLLGIQEEMIDSAAQRSILHKRLEKFKAEKNDALIRETEGLINRLKGTDRFLIELEQARLKYKSDDPVVQRRIDKMFRDTRRALVGR